MIPLATDSITITRVVDATDVDPYDPPASHPVPATVASNVRAVISTPMASTKLTGGDRVVYTATLRCDPVDLQVGDKVTNAVDGNAWIVMWVKPQSGLGLTFMLANLRLVQGAT